MYHNLISEPKTIQLNATHYFIMKVPNKTELQEIASNHSSDIEFKGFMKLYKSYTKKNIFIFSKQYNLLASNTILGLGNPLRFRKNLL